MTMEYITREVDALRRRFHEDDPIRLCEAMGIIVAREPMGTYHGACKGFFMAQSRKRLVMINADLPAELQRVITAHELGHAVLHRKALGINTFHDFALFDNTSVMEYQANIFAAEYLMPDEAVLDRLNDDISFFAAAAQLRVPPELLDFKFRSMKRKGYKVIDPPLHCCGDFLKGVDIDGGCTSD